MPTLRYALLVLAFSIAANTHAQIPAGSSARSTPSEDEKVEKRAAEVIMKAEARFKEGELLLKANKPKQAREGFDRAIDTIIESGIDVRENNRLRTYYLDLVERIYRLEVPQQQSAPRAELAPLASVNYTGQSQTDKSEQEAGFKQQKFEPSPLDELSKLLLRESILTKIKARMGDTIAKIAERYNVSAVEVSRLNGIAVNAELQPGQEIKVLTPAPESAPLEANCTSNQIRDVELRGFRLGMSLEVVQRRIPNIKMQSSDQFGYARVRILPGINITRTQGDRLDLKGVSAAFLDFLDNHLTDIYMLYDNSIKWDNADEFISRISEVLKIPNRWQPFRENESSLTGDLKSLKCGPFYFVAGITVVNYYKKLPVVFLSNAGATQTLEKRMRDEAERLRQKKLREEEERRKAFKP